MERTGRKIHVGGKERARERTVRGYERSTIRKEEIEKIKPKKIHG